MIFGKTQMKTNIILIDWVINISVHTYQLGVIYIIMIFDAHIPAWCYIYYDFCTHVPAWRYIYKWFQTYQLGVMYINDFRRTSLALYISMISDVPARRYISQWFQTYQLGVELVDDRLVLLILILHFLRLLVVVHGQLLQCLQHFLYLNTTTQVITHVNVKHNTSQNNVKQVIIQQYICETKQI